MRKIAMLATVAGFAVTLLAVPAHAQATRTWVSGVGDDANPCSRTAPCKTFAGAISKTASGGEINCLDPGGFGAVTITKAMTISCEMGTAGVLVSGTNAIVINAPATDRVFLKGLDFEGLGTGLNAIQFNTGALLHVEDCVIRDFTGFGIQIKPSTAANFVILRTTLFNNAAGAAGGGIQVRPTALFTSGTIEKVTMNRNATGLAVDGGGGTTGINVSVHDSVIASSTGSGILNTSTVVTNVMVQNSVISNNATGLLTANTGAFIRIGTSSIQGNGTAVNGANVLSYLNNQINGNGGGEAINPVPGGLH